MYIAVLAWVVAHASCAGGAQVFSDALADGADILTWMMRDSELQPLGDFADACLAQVAAHVTRMQSPPSSRQSSESFAWAEAFDALMRGIASIIRRYHHPHVAWGGAEPTCDLHRRLFTPLDGTMSRARRTRLECERLAFEAKVSA